MISIVRFDGIDEFSYEVNGNMVLRKEAGVTWTQTFNAENRLASDSNGTDTWSFTYDGDGNRIKQVNPDGKITLFLGGGIYSVEDAAGTPEVTKYYSVAGQRVAMNNTVDGLQYLLTDHLGSVSAALDASGSLVSGSEQRYLPFGGLRLEPGITQTDFAFTGQRNLAAVGLMDYNARWYGQTVGAFTQPDRVMPFFGNPQSLNRFSYVLNNPLRLIDPSGNIPCLDIAGDCGNPYTPTSPPPGICYYCYGSSTPQPGGGENGENGEKGNTPKFCVIRPEKCKEIIDKIKKAFWDLELVSARSMGLDIWGQGGFIWEKGGGKGWGVVCNWVEGTCATYTFDSDFDYLGTPNIAQGGLSLTGTEYVGASQWSSLQGPSKFGALNIALDTVADPGIGWGGSLATTGEGLFIDPGSHMPITGEYGTLSVGVDLGTTIISGGGVIGTSNTLVNPPFIRPGFWPLRWLTE